MQRLTFSLIAAGLALAGSALAAPSDITIPGDHVFPESITSGHDGTIYVGSVGQGMVYRVKPGDATATPFIEPNKDLRSVFGVLADAKTHSLYACTNDMSARGITTPGGSGPSALVVFDLPTGKLKGSYPFPGGTGMCNDIAVGKDGAAYVTDSLNPRVLRLKPGATALETWVENPVFGTQGINLDGIAFGADGNLYLTGFGTGKLFRVAVGKDGSAGAVTDLKLSAPVTRPDGMRPLAGGKGTTFLLIEGGQLDKVTLDGDQAMIAVLKTGFTSSVAVTQVGRTAWVAEGQLNYMFDPKLKGQTPAPFQAHAVALP